MMIGKTISHYRILEKLGEGGMGVVYKAQDTKLNRKVALKFLPSSLSSDKDARTRFIKEAQTASALDHPNICSIYEIGEAKPAPGEPGEGQSFIAMACYDGETLKERIDTPPPSPPLTKGGIKGGLAIDEIISIAIQVAKGLSRAHEEGIIHRDIKPANIMITKRGEVKILDFGLAKLAGQTRLTRSGTTLGTVAYMSPEQARGEEADQRSDIWSLGVVLYEMLTGELPFKGEFEQAMIYAIINEQAPDLAQLYPDLPNEFVQIVNKALSKDLNQRYQTIEEMLEDFKPLSSEAATLIQEPLSKIIGRLWRKKKIRRWTLSLVSILLLVIILLISRPFIFKDVLQAKPVPIAIISFENQTGNSSYNYLRSAIPNLLITSLEQSSGLQVTTQERLRELLKQMGKEDINFIDSETGFELCSREGVQKMLVGTIVQAGEIFATNIKVLDVQSKELLSSANSKGRGVESLLERQIDDLSQQVSRELGLSEKSIQQEQRPITQLITDSWEAYTYYEKACEYSEKFYWKENRQMLELAVQADSTFALAWLDLADYYQGDKKTQALEIAERYKHKIPEKERMYREAWDYAGSNFDKADSIYRLLVQRYPRESRAQHALGTLYFMHGFSDKALEQYSLVIELNPANHHAWNNLGFIYADRGEFGKAIECMKRYVQNSPGDANPFDSFGDIYIMVGDIDEAIQTYRKAQAVKSDWNVDIKLAFSYALKEDYTQAIKYIANACKPCFGETGFANIVTGIYYYYQGCRNQTMYNTRQVAQIIDSLGVESANQSRAEILNSWIYYKRGNYTASRLSSQKATAYFLEKNKKETWQFFHKARHAFFVGLIQLKQNRPDSARIYLTQLSNVIEEHQSLLHKGQKDAKLETSQYYHHLLLAEILLTETKIKEALQQAESIPEFTAFESGAVYLLDLNFPPRDDVKARIYYQAGKIDQAIREYEDMTLFDSEHRDRRFIPAEYHYRLARLYEEKGEKQKAIDRYRHFVEVWKDADPDIAELVDAKKRLAELTTKK